MDEESSTEEATNRNNRILRNINNLYTFEVEKNKEPGKKLRQMSPDKICDYFFKGEEGSWGANKSFNVLTYSFETEDNNFAKTNYGAIEANRIAYLSHFPIVISPNIFWLMILQGFSRYMEINDNSERLRNKFVKNKRKKDIEIETGLNLFMASDEQWNFMIQKLLNETLKNINIDKTILEKFNKNFTTSTTEAEVGNNVTILSSFKKYFA